ncbi:MAG: DEAD/DEAH box helicase [Gemmataceae bacterium]
MADSDAPVVENGFALLGLDERLVAALAARGYSKPTPVQRETIPPLLAGKDLIGLAATGTGKTAAFALPILHRLAAQGKKSQQPSALILVPTRELCIQVATAVSHYGKPVGVRVVPVYGGAGFSEQARAIRRGGEVIVATPGRALDHLRRGTMDLTGVSEVVLDEADEMLDMGFAEDLDAILTATPTTRQTMLFSATMPPRIATIAEKHLREPVKISVAKAVVPPGEAPKVRQTLYLVPPEHKTNALARALEHEAPSSAIIFCRTRHEAESVADALTGRGYRPQALHGGLSQEMRDRVMRKFRDGASSLLVATDVAARGLDITHLSHVVNYGVPQMAETYVHRIGRVGRAGREGVAITIAEPREGGALRQIERLAGRRLEPARVPTNADLKKQRSQRLKDHAITMRGTEPATGFAALAKELLQDADATETLAAALALVAKHAHPADDGPEVPNLAPPPRPATKQRPGAPVEPRPRRGSDGMERVFISVGREAGFGRREIIAMLGHEVGLGTRDIGTITVTDRFCLVDVPAVATEEVIDRLNDVRVRGRRLQARRDRANASTAPE